VAAVLLGMMLLDVDASRVIAAVNEWTCQPVVNDNRRCAQIPLATLVRTALSDIQTVRSFELPPSLVTLV
jgi:hypothetical protein